MHSSISSSDSRLPRGNWGRTWALTAVILAVVIAGVELRLRFLGWLPSVPDPGAWILARSRLTPTSTVLIGTSRMETGLDPQVWASVTGEVPVNLSAFGGSPLPVLESLAKDTTFAGSVVCDCPPFVLFNLNWADEKVEQMTAYEATLSSPAKWSEARISVLVNGHLVIRRPELSVRRRLEALWDPGPPEVVVRRTRAMRPDRFYPMDFIGRTREGEPPQPGETTPSPRVFGSEAEEVMRRLEATVRPISERGGRVALVKFPSCGRRKKHEDSLYPRDMYWDEMVRRISAPALHTEDFPDLSNVDCPDGSHMDMRYAGGFTRALALRILEAWSAQAAETTTMEQ